MSDHNGTNAETPPERSVRVAAIKQDPRALARLKEVQSKGAGFWWTALIVMVLLSEQSALAINLVAPALAPLSAEFETTQIIWSITAFVLVGGIMTPIAGKLGDIYGKRKILLIFGAIATLGSTIAALAPSFEVLVLGRVLGGFSAAFLPLIYSLIRDVFPEKRRALGISIATNGVGIVTIGGPFLAGWLIDDISPRAVFWFVVAISVPGLLLTAALVPETATRVKQKIDALGALMLGVGVGAVLLGLSQAQTWGWGDARTVLCLIGGAALLVAWVRWEQRVEDPLISIELLRSKPILLTIIAGSLAFATITAIASFLPLMMQTPREATGGGYGFGLSATEVAVYFLPAGILTVASGVFAGVTAKRIGFRANFIIGAAIVGVAGMWLGLMHDDGWMIVVGWGAVGAGAVIFAAMPNLVLLATPPDQRAVAAGMAGTATAVSGSILTQIVSVILNGHVGSVVGGAPIYENAGFTIAFTIAGAVALLGAIVGFFIPHGRPERSGTPVGAVAVEELHAPVAT